MQKNAQTGYWLGMSIRLTFLSGRSRGVQWVLRPTKDWHQPIVDGYVDGVIYGEASGAGDDLAKPEWENAFGGR
jgi:hypothetical protein